MVNFPCIAFIVRSHGAIDWNAAETLLTHGPLIRGPL